MYLQLLHPSSSNNLAEEMIEKVVMIPGLSSRDVDCCCTISTILNHLIPAYTKHFECY